MVQENVHAVQLQKNKRIRGDYVSISLYYNPKEVNILFYIA